MFADRGYGEYDSLLNDMTHNHLLGCGLDKVLFQPNWPLIMKLLGF